MSTDVGCEIFTLFSNWLGDKKIPSQTIPIAGRVAD